MKICIDCGEPIKYGEFLAITRKQFKKWQFLRHSGEGPMPEWVRNALATGDLSELCPADRRYIEELRGQG